MLRAFNNHKKIHEHVFQRSHMKNNSAKANHVNGCEYFKGSFKMLYEYRTQQPLKIVFCFFPKFMV